MVKHRSSSRSIISSSSSSARFFSIKAITLYLIFVFAFTIWVLVFSSRNIQTDDQTQHQQQQHRDLIKWDEFPPPYSPPRKNLQKSSEDTQLWTPPFSFGLHPCVKPTPIYKESDHYIAVRSNGGLNQMRTGVDYACTPEEVQQHFQSCGTVHRVTILTDKFGQPKGFAYVEFVEVEAIQEALQLNESELHGRQLKVLPKRTNVPGLKQYRGRRFNPYMGYRFRRPFMSPYMYSPYGYGKAPRFRRPMRYMPYQ